MLTRSRASLASGGARRGGARLVRWAAFFLPHIPDFGSVRGNAALPPRGLRKWSRCTRRDRTAARSLALCSNPLSGRLRPRRPPRRSLRCSCSPTAPAPTSRWRCHWCSDCCSSERELPSRVRRLRRSPRVPRRRELQPRSGRGQPCSSPAWASLRSRPRVGRGRLPRPRGWIVLVVVMIVVGVRIPAAVSDEAWRSATGPRTCAPGSARRTPIRRLPVPVGAFAALDSLARRHRAVATRDAHSLEVEAVAELRTDGLLLVLTMLAIPIVGAVRRRNDTLVRRLPPHTSCLPSMRVWTGTCGSSRPYGLPGMTAAVVLVTVPGGSRCLWVRGGQRPRSSSQSP